MWTAARALATALLLAAAIPPPAASAARPDGSLVIVIDPGHGGDKDGALGPHHLREKDVALSIARKLQLDLEARGHEVILTRAADDSLDLAPRIELANEKKADLFLSVHLNSMPTAESRRVTQGVETYFLSADASDEAAAAVARAENADRADAAPAADGALGLILADLARSAAHADSSLLAYAIHGKLVAETGARDRGVRQAPFAVLEGATMPAVLLEVGYISHPRESKRLADEAEQRKIAHAVVEGVEDFRRAVVAKQERNLDGARSHAAAD